MSRRVTAYAMMVVAGGSMSPAGAEVGTAAPAAPQEVRECTPRPSGDGGDAPDWAIFLDGRALRLHSSRQGATPTLPDSVTSRDPERVEVVCSRRAAEMFGVRVRYGVVSAWTQDPLEGWRGILATVQNAQVRHSMAHGTVEDPSGIAAGVESPLTLSGRVVGDEWLAELTHPRVAIVCWVSSDPALRPDEIAPTRTGPPPRADEPRCDPLRDPDRIGL